MMQRGVGSVHRMKADPNSKNNARRRFADPRIIEFQPRLRPDKRKDAPILDPLQQFKITDERLRMKQNLAAAIVLAFLMFAGLWLVSALTASSRMLNCIETGSRTCLPIDRNGSQIR
jgi:hypothetical protein